MKPYTAYPSRLTAYACNNPPGVKFLMRPMHIPALCPPGLQRRLAHCEGVPYALLLCLFLLCGIAAGCSGKVEPHVMRNGLARGNIAALSERVAEKHADGEDFDVALNMARLYQMKGEWENSIASYNEALAILEEFEDRALINLREIAGNAGMFALARGAKGYFGAGHERSLLHTFNSLNYLMLGDINGAAVELRKMEHRQERWLAESAERLQKATEDAKGRELSSPEQLPQGYSMREILSDAAGRHIASTYQDPFSYALSATVCNLASDPEYAAVSGKRAVALNPLAAHIVNAEEQGKARSQKKGRTAPVVLRQTRPPEQENTSLDVFIITLTGLGPALYLERVYLWGPGIGRFSIDLPSYLRPIDTLNPPEILLGEKKFEAVPLLHVDALAYRALWDELRFETGAAITRAAIRVGAAYTAYAVAHSHKDTRQYSPLIGALTSVVLDLTSRIFDDNVRNWETLPSTGYLTLAKVPCGSELVVTIDGTERRLHLPEEGKTVVVLVSYITQNHMRVDYAVY